jgi:uncharacterized protein YbbK (DUF523 family)
MEKVKKFRCRGISLAHGGAFSGKPKKGGGIFAAMLKGNGIRVLG